MSKIMKYRIAWENTRGIRWRAVSGERIDIPNALGAQFAIHEEEKQPVIHPCRFVVTHLETGCAAGCGPSRKTAIEDARRNLARVDAKELRKVVERSVQHCQQITRRMAKAA